MISATFKIDNFMKKFANVEQKVTARVRTLVQKTVYYIDAKVHERTPVHTGLAIRNMIWSVDAPAGAAHDAIDTGPTGYTSRMALGAEPRRAANEAAARQSLQALDFTDPFHVYYLTNLAEDMTLIEEGSAGLPGRYRAPNGVFAITMAEVEARLKSGAM